MNKACASFFKGVIIRWRNQDTAVTRIQSSVCNMNAAELLMPFLGSYGNFGNNCFVVFIVDYKVPPYCFFSLREKKKS